MIWDERTEGNAELERWIVEHLDKLTAQQPGMVRRIRKERKDFRIAMYRKWKPALDLFEVFIEYCDEALVNFAEKHVEQAEREQDVVFLVLGEIAIRAQRTASEIRILLLNGFGLGAFAHWRTLYELMVVAQFIAEHGRDVADAYYQFVIVDETKVLRYIAGYRNRKGIPILPEQKRGLEQREARSVELYKEFAASDRDTYPWAKKVLKTANLHAMKEDISEHAWWGYYLQANALVHASPTGTRPSQITNPLLATLATGAPSLDGLTDAASITIEVLHRILKTLLNTKPDMETFGDLEALYRLAHRTIRAFNDIG